MNDEVEAARVSFKTRPCHGCGKPIVWGRSEDGKKRYPLDPRAPVFEVERTASGEYVARISATALVSHFATCPNADQFSSSRK